MSLNAPALRVVSYNLRVDHSADEGTVHAWEPHRRPLVCSSLLALKADLVGVPEPSPGQCCFSPETRGVIE